jgi:hypothetical protein
MNIACSDETVVTTVRAIFLKYEVSRVRQQGPNFGDPMIWVMVDVAMNEDKERALRREIAGTAGAIIH